MKIIIKMPSFLGDSIMTLPAFELLKKEYPKASFTVICKPSAKDIFRNKGIDKIIIDNTKSSKRGRIKRTFTLLKQIKTNKYDLGVLFHNTFLDALIFKLSHIETIIGYEKEGRKILLNFWLKIDRTRHYVNHYANLINQYLNNKYTILPPMLLNIEKSTLIQKRSQPLIGFVLGGDNKGIRQYPQTMAIELFKLFQQDNIDIILLGDKEDNQNNKVYEKILIQQNQSVLNLSGKTKVSEFIDSIAMLDLLITIDTSSMHIAAATGTNFLVLVGKGSSAFDTVYPKVDFGNYIFKGNSLIKDEDFIKAIHPKDIYQKIKECF
jgi:heptosyltransferase-2